MAVGGSLDGWATRWLPSSSAGWLADWLERSTGEFHLASKYGKNASCSSGGINGVPQGYVCFVHPCGCARVDTLRSYA